MNKVNGKIPTVGGYSDVSRIISNILLKGQASRHRPSRVIISVVLLAVIQMIFPAPRVSAEGHLVQQTAALRAPFHYQLFAMSDIPYYDIDASIAPVQCVQWKLE